MIRRLLCLSSGPVIAVAVIVFVRQAWYSLAYNGVVSSGSLDWFPLVAVGLGSVLVITTALMCRGRSRNRSRKTHSEAAMSRRRKLIALALVASVSILAPGSIEARDESTLSKFLEGLNGIWEKVKKLDSANNEDKHEIDKHITAIALLNLGNAILEMTNAKDQLIIEISKHGSDYVMAVDDPHVAAVKALIGCVRTKVHDLAPLISSFQELEDRTLETTLNAGLRNKTVAMNDLVSQNGIEKMPGEDNKQALLREAGEVREVSAKLYLATTQAAHVLDKYAVVEHATACQPAH
jgi:hypothetical protein